MVRLPDRAVLPAAVALLGAAVFVLARWHFAAHGDITRFVVAGRTWANPARTPHGLAIVPGPGYDGQMYYRMALDPLNLSVAPVHGITLDTTLRRQRIGYPIIAWLFAGAGNQVAVPWALVAVNVVGCGLTGLFGGMLARQLGRHSLWGLLFAGYFGLVFTLGRDLTEMAGLVFMMAGLVAIRQCRWEFAGLGLAAGVLCRETVLLVAMGLFVVRVTEIVRRRADPSFGRQDLAWGIPIIAFGAWQAANYLRYGALPLTDDKVNTGAPLVGMSHGLSDAVRSLTVNHEVILAQFVVLFIVAGLALSSLGRTRATAAEQVAFVLALVLVVSLSSRIWTNDPFQFRTMTDMFVLGAIVVLGSRRGRLRIPSLLLSVAPLAMWAVDAVWQAKFI